MVDTRLCSRRDSVAQVSTDGNDAVREGLSMGCGPNGFVVGLKVDQAAQIMEHAPASTGVPSCTISSTTFVLSGTMRRCLCY